MRIGKLSERLSYANVMATLAFFTALAGGAYAATQINGKQIAKHSIPANRLVRGATVPRAVLADRVEHLLITKGRHRRHRRAADLASAAQTSGPSSTVVSLSVGQSATLFQSGPFTITARCTDQGNGKYKISIDGSATVDWYSGPTHYSPGDTDTLYSNTDTQPDAYTNTGGSMVASDGESLTLGTYTTTLHFLGDCSFSGSAIA